MVRKRSEDRHDQALRRVPVLPLRDVVVYPHMVIPLFVGREKSIESLDAAMNDDKRVLLIAQRSADIDDPGAQDMYEVGAVATILQMLKLPDNTVKVLVEGVERVEIVDLAEEDNRLMAGCRSAPDTQADNPRELEVLMRSVLSLCEQYVKLNKKVPAEVLSSLSNIEEPGRLADTIAAHMQLRIDQKQQLLELRDVGQRLEKIMALIEGEIDVLQIEKRIRGRVKQQMERSQREYYLNEQMKAIQKEMGDLDESGSELDDLQKKIEQSGMSPEARAKADGELAKLRMMSPMSAEASVVRNYLETLVALPWQKKTRTRRDIKRAQAVLDADHYGLERVKDRILEYLAVQQRVRKLKGPILCLVGPPGVGKTSLGQSIARATNRKFVRMSLGGVRDEAEIRGHRRTYIGSMPGKIVQSLSRVGVKNPLFLLDEVDKMSMDFRGDPSSALLEVLDPEQNATFNDHYLEVDFDLSGIMFVATANTLNLPPALLDRMEVIRLPGYIEEEKLAIATRYLVPKQMKRNGIKTGELEISEPALRYIIRHYTREAGVRNLEREIAKVCRKVVKNLLQQPDLKKVALTPENMSDYLGVERYRYGVAEQEDQVGRCTGLAWTEFGGELLTIEAGVVPGKGRLSHTGSLGEVMRESVQAAFTVVRSRATTLGIEKDFYQKFDFHLHMPEGAIPKDGPSAGVGMCTAMVSALTGIPVRADVSMTGEITLRGEVLPIGGLKEKLVAAHRGGIKVVLIPDENRKDLADIPENIKADLDIRPVRWVDEILSVALQRMPLPLDEEAASGGHRGESEEVKGKGEVRAH